MNWEPSNTNAEESLIGSLVVAGGDDYVFSTVEPKDFFNKLYQRYYEAMLLTKSRNEVIDYATISGLLGDRDFTDLGNIINNTASTANIKAYAVIVKNKAAERRAITLSLEAIEVIKGEGTTQEKTAAASALSADIAVTTDDHKPLHVKEIAREWLDTYVARTADDAPKGLKFGIEGVDKIYGHRAIGECDFVVLGARPKMGKTQWLVKVCSSIARDTNRAVLLFSMEMPATQLFERFLTDSSKVQGDKFYRPMNDNEFSMVGKAISELRDTRLYIDDRPNLSIAQVRATAKKFKEDHGEIVIGLDYFTLMKIKEGGRTDLAFGANSTGLKNITKELKCPIILLGQLSRGVDSRPNKRPMISDLRESGSIEQDADSIQFLYRESVYNHDSPLGGLTENIVAANRHGETGTAFIEMKGGWFEDVSEAQANHALGSAEKQDDWG